VIIEAVSLSDWERGYDAGYRAALGTARRDIGRDIGMATKTKKKRKPSAYSKRYGTAFRSLKKKHPRMAFASISSKAHKLAKKK